MNKYKAILFDCDGTLIDSEIINAQGMSDILIRLGHQKYTLDFCLKNFIGCSAIEIIETLEELDIKNPHATLDLMHNQALSLAEQNLQPMKNAIKMLNNIVHPKCLVSNGDRRTVLHFLKLTELDKFFPHNLVFTREQVAKPKPSPDMYLLAAEKMNTTAENCLVIEDSVIGVTAAKNAGMTVLGFTGANSFHEHMKNAVKKAGADHIIHDLLDILKFL